MKRVLLIIIFFTALSSVHAQSNSLVYALPRTSIEVSVEIHKETYIPGPYVRYAESLLSVSDVSAREETSYSMGNIEMRPVVEADYEYIYSLPIDPKGNVNATFMSLSSEGLIFTMNDQDVKSMGANLSKPLKNFKMFPDQLPTYPMETQRVTLYDRIKTDSGFTNVPYQQSVVDMKDPQKKAEEAAKFLFSLRQRRFELITGDVDNAFSGSSLKDALDEINRLEREYLSLFLGKSIVESRVYKFYVSPDKAANEKTYNVFDFSESDGVLSEASRTSTAVTLNVTPTGKINRVEGGGGSSSKSSNIFYRVPETANIQLMLGSKEACSGKMHIYQMGKEFSIPYDAKLK